MPGLSFRIRETSWRKGLPIAFLVALGVMLPVIYGTWYFHYGGAEAEKERTLVGLAGRDAADDARKAIGKENFQLYAILCGSFPQAPGLGGLSDEYRAAFGYRFLILFGEEGITPEQRAVNQSVIQYLQLYNQTMYEHVNRQYPDWREKVRHKDLSRD